MFEMFGESVGGKPSTVVGTGEPLFGGLHNSVTCKDVMKALAESCKMTYSESTGSWIESSIDRMTFDELSSVRFSIWLPPSHYFPVVETHHHAFEGLVLSKRFKMFRAQRSCLGILDLLRMKSQQWVQIPDFVDSYTFVAFPMIWHWPTEFKLLQTILSVSQRALLKQSNLKISLPKLRFDVPVAKPHTPFSLNKSLWRKQKHPCSAFHKH